MTPNTYSTILEKDFSKFIGHFAPCGFHQQVFNLAYLPANQDYEFQSAAGLQPCSEVGHFFFLHGKEDTRKS